MDHFAVVTTLYTLHFICCYGFITVILLILSVYIDKPNNGISCVRHE